MWFHCHVIPLYNHKPFVDTISDSGNTSVMLLGALLQSMASAIGSFQILFLYFWKIPCILGYRDRWSKFLSISSFGFSFAHPWFPRFWAALPIFVHTSGPWSGLAVDSLFVSLPPGPRILWEVFQSIERKLRKTCPRIWQNFCSNRHSKNHQHVFLATRPDLYE